MRGQAHFVIKTIKAAQAKPQGAAEVLLGLRTDIQRRKAAFLLEAFTMVALVPQACERLDA